MSINFATLQGLTIPEGVVVQIEKDGVILWTAGGPVILQVAKITSDTYANETTYTGEEFILLDIYPKTNGTVKVTYGGLTKTITDTSGAAEPNAQQVFFGTFNGVSDSVTTPASGELKIEGDYVAFADGTYYATSKAILPGYCNCTIGISEWGNCETIAASAFYWSEGLVLDSIPGEIKSIGGSAFYSCGGLRFSDNFFNDGLISIGNSAFCMHDLDDTLVGTVDSITIPETVTNIGVSAFDGPVVSSVSRPLFKRVIVLPTTPPTGLGPTAHCFGEPSGSYPFEIIVPTGCGAAYKAAEGWSLYADYIVEA